MRGGISALMLFNTLKQYVIKAKNQKPKTKKPKTKNQKNKNQKNKETKKNNLSGELGPGPNIGFLVFSRVSCFWGSAAGWPVLAVRWPGLGPGVLVPGAWQLAGLAGLPPLGLSAGPPPCLPSLLVRICSINKGFG